MPRLFTALELPNSVANYLFSRKGKLDGAHWIDQENYHITLCYLGDVDNRCADEFADGLDLVSGKSINIALDHLDIFGGNNPRALIAKIAREPSLLELQSSHQRIARNVTKKTDTRKFQPHVTLARLKNTYSWQAAAFLSETGVFKKLNFTAIRFVLMSARSSKGGGPYIVEESYPLISRS